jgi:hypothetical protein
MLKIKDKGLSFVMNVQGYEYPNAMDYHDANWLVVKIKSNDQSNSWEAKDSCLLTYELEELKNWLISIDEGVDVSPDIKFTEGELSFYFDKDKYILTAGLDFNFHPKGSNYNYKDGGDSQYKLVFPMINKIPDVIRSLGELIDKYPERMKSRKGR